MNDKYRQELINNLKSIGVSEQDAYDFLEKQERLDTQHKFLNAQTQGQQMTQQIGLTSTVEFYETRKDIIRACVDEVLDTYDLDVEVPEPQRVAFDIMTNVNAGLRQRNTMLMANGRADEKYKLLKGLEPDTVAQIILWTGRYANIVLDNGETRLAVHQTKGKLKGLWRVAWVFDGDNPEYNDLVRDIQSYASFSTQEINTTIRIIRCNAPVITPTTDPRYVAVGNGVYDRTDKKLIEWDDVSDDLVFTSKVLTDYHPHVAPVYITEPDGHVWDFDSWLEDFMSNPVYAVGETEDCDDNGIIGWKCNKEKVNTLWEFMAHAFMPHAFEDRRLLILQDGTFAGKGNNGKGAFCAMLTAVVGEDPVARNICSIKLEDWGNDFKVAQILTATLNIADENAVDVYIDDIADLKSATTHDNVTINHKREKPFRIKPYIAPVFCVNVAPRVKDKSSSFIRRLIIVDCNKRYPVGQKNKTYIKNDYLQRREVCEYILSKVLDEYGHLIGFTDADFIDANLDNFVFQNNSVVQFLLEITEETVWRFLPYSFLYDAYKGWYENNYNARTNMSSEKFRSEVDAWVQGRTDWIAHFTNDKAGNTQRKAVYPKDSFMFDKPEPLVLKYNMTAWKNPNPHAKGIQQAQVPATMLYMTPENNRKNVMGIERVKGKAQYEDPVVCNTDLVGEVVTDEEGNITEFIPSPETNTNLEEIYDGAHYRLRDKRTMQIVGKPYDKE